MGTTAFKVRQDALVKLRVALPGVQVTDGNPGNDADSEWLMLGQIKWSSEVFATLGARQREEDYSIDLFLNIRLKGVDEAEAYKRLGELTVIIEQTIKNNANPNVAGVTFTELIPRRVFGAPWDKIGYEAQFDAVIRVKARV